MDFSKSKFFNLSNKKYLSELLYVDKSRLKNVSEEFIASRFSTKVKNKERVLYNPNPEQKKVLKRIVKIISQINLPEYAFGGVKKRNYIGNAEIHINNKFLLIIDIKDFFPSTRDSYIYDMFKNKFNVSTDIAKILTDFVTVPVDNGKERYLPQGYPTSPLISILAYLDMYERIYKIAAKWNMQFSCYYDDLTLSSEKFIPKSLKRKIIKVIESYGFKVHPNKSKLVIKENTKITGVILHENELKVPKNLYQKLHNSYLHLKSMDKNQNDYTKEEFVDICNKIQGLSSAIKSINSSKNLDRYLNEVKYVRKKYCISYRKYNIKI